MPRSPTMTMRSILKSLRNLLGNSPGRPVTLARLGPVGISYTECYPVSYTVQVALPDPVRT